MKYQEGDGSAGGTVAGEEAVTKNDVTVQRADLLQNRRLPIQAAVGFQKGDRDETETA